MRASSQTEMIIWTALVVVLVGVGVGISVLTPPESISKTRALTAKQETSIQADRGPASFSGIDIDEKGTQAVDFTLPCADHGTFSNNIVQVRISGSLCAPHAKQQIAASEIRNMTNGFSATVFPGPKSNAFTTDYMTLAPGENLIRIQHILKSGGKVDRDFTIIRN